MEKEIFTAIGLMSGTSMDGIDLALIESDGKSIINRKKFAYFAYDEAMKKSLNHLIYGNPKLAEIKEIENQFTILHAQVVNEFCTSQNIAKNRIDLIAFHGHTIFHDAPRGLTWQIGDKELLSVKTGIKVIKNFRSFDMANGGQGAPLVPIYHFHILDHQERPAVVLNIGGISNITYIPSGDENEVEAFDVCFGNAPFDDLMKKKLGKDFDESGKLAKAGDADFILADRILQNEIFSQKPPKAFDRDDFSDLLSPINSLKVEDALATFAYMHAKALEKNIEFLSKTHDNQEIKAIYVCGGGRKNQAVIDEMKKWLKRVEVKMIEEIGFDGDAIEAEAFAFLGIRMVKGLPISFRKTTGVSPEIDYALAFSR